MPRFHRPAAAMCAAAGLVTLVAAAAAPPAQDRFTPGILDALPFRNFGPFRAGAWITDFAVPAAPEREHRYTFYVGTRNGGVWKTDNGGTTFRPIFDATGQLSIGAVAVAPSDHRIVWVGTGEAFVVRYSYPGNGVYLSTDAGDTWQHTGLAPTQHIARILIHPVNPDVVYVASMGPLHTTSQDRGVYRTRDAGRTWDHVLAIDDETGVIELVMDPANPDVLYAAAYDKERVAWRLRQGGPGSGIYKTTNAGTTWTRLGGGLPTGNIGRIGLDVFRGDSNVVYALVENLNPRPDGLPQPSPVGGGIGEVYRSDDGGRTWRMTHDPSVNVGGKAPYSFNWLRIDPRDDRKVYVTSVYVAHTTDGGRTWHDLETPRVRFRNMFGDIRAIWVDPDDPDRLLVGSDGGVYQTLDGGRSVKHFANLPLGEVYAVAVDMDDPYHLHAGLQDHESWRAPVNGFAGSIGVEHWVTVGTGDGMYNAVDPIDSRWVYNTQQFGGHVRHNLATGERTGIVPPQPAGPPRLRYTWTTPLVLSPHDPRTLLTGAQMVLRSRDRGDTWDAISPDLTSADGAAADSPGRFTPEPKGLRIETNWGNYRLFGDDVLATPNEPNAMSIVYWQREASGGPVAIRVLDGAGSVVYTAQQPANAGLHRVFWNLRVPAAGPGGRGAGRGGGRGGGGAPAPPGEYTVALEAAGRTLTQPATVKPPVMLPRISGPGSVAPGGTR